MGGWRVASTAATVAPDICASQIQQESCDIIECQRGNQEEGGGTHKVVTDKGIAAACEGTQLHWYPGDLPGHVQPQMLRSCELSNTLGRRSTGPT